MQIRHRHSVLVASVLSLAVLGCEGWPGGSATGNSGEEQDGSEEQSASSDTSTQISEDVLRDEICGDRDPCHLDRNWEAGTDDRGRQLLVQQVRRSEREDRPEEMSEEPLHLEWWLARVGGGTVASRQLLASNKIRRGPAYNKYEVEVDPGRFRYRRRTRAGAPRYFTNEHIFELSPLRLVERYSATEGMKRTHADRIDWTEFRGRRYWFLPECGEDGKPAEAPPEEREEWYSYEIIPRADLGASFRDEGWRKTAIESCAAQVDSRGNRDVDEIGRGFVVHGESGSPDDARMRAVFGAPTELFVEIEDDRWVRDADSKILEDHVEIWFDDEIEGGRCLPAETSPRQLGVGLDGEVWTPAGGEADGALDVSTAHTDSEGTVEEGGPADGAEAGRARLKIAFDEKPGVVTVVYSDSDDGTEQERLIATSDLEGGESATLGSTREPEEAFGSCAVDDGAVVFEPDQSFEPEEAAVQLGIER